MNPLYDLIGVERYSILHIYNSNLQAVKTNPNNWRDDQIKAMFDSFYKEVCSWRDDFDTESLSDFWGIGVNYDGCEPGINDPFLGLFQELINIATNPITYKH